MAVGVYITFRLLDIADMTCDGSFSQQEVSEQNVILTNHGNPIVAILVATLGGGFSWICDWFITY